MREGDVEALASKVLGTIDRGSLTTSQRALIAVRLKSLYEPSAKQRRLANLRQFGGVVPESRGRARALAAHAVGVSERTVAKSERILRDGVDELVEMVRVGKLRTDPAERISRKGIDEQKVILAEMACPRVYFVQAGRGGPVKIGWSVNVDRRVSAMRNANAEDLVLLGTLPGDQALERLLHRRFSDHRIRGEWFRPIGELLALAASAAEKAGGRRCR